MHAVCAGIQPAERPPRTTQLACPLAWQVRNGHAGLACQDMQCMLLSYVSQSYWTLVNGSVSGDDLFCMTSNVVADAVWTAAPVVTLLCTQAQKWW